MKWISTIVGTVVAVLYSYGICYGDVGGVSSLNEHADLLWYIVVGLGGIMYSGAAVLLVMGIKMVLDHDRRLTKLETRCEDQHKEE